jgi:hypothetical protein
MSPSVRVCRISGEWIALSDGDICIEGSEDGSFVLRFDAQLQTHSSLLRKKLFWVDTNLVNQWRREDNAEYQKLSYGVLRPLRKELSK